MADFHREPEWDQGADRHSVLTDPVVTVRQLSRFDYRKHYSRIDNALVFTTPKGGYESYLPPRRPTRSEIAAKRFSAVYEVDMGIHRCETSLHLPSDSDAFDFAAQLETVWQVIRPELFVASGERDVPALIARLLEELMRPVSRAFPIDHGSAAECAVRTALEAAGPVGGDAGLRVSWTVHLRLDDEAIAHQRELRQIRYADEKLDSTHALAMREDRLVAERESAQTRQQHELAMLQAQQQLELQQIEQQKIAYYQHYLQHGGVAAWAFHLAKHPEDSRLVMENLRQDQLALIRSQMEVALNVLRGDGVQEYELEGPRKYALQVVEEILTKNLPGADPALPGPGSLSWDPVPDSVPAPTDTPSPGPVRGDTPTPVPAPPGDAPPPTPTDTAREER